MNKLFTKIATAIAGFAMVVGVGVGIGLNVSKKANMVDALSGTLGDKVTSSNFAANQTVIMVDSDVEKYVKSITTGSSGWLSTNGGTADNAMEFTLGGTASAASLKTSENKYVGFTGTKNVSLNNDSTAPFYIDTSGNVCIGDSNHVLRHNDSNKGFRVYDNEFKVANLYYVNAGSGTYTVTYNANGGEGSITDTSSPYSSGTTVTILNNTFTRDGYSFVCFNTQANGFGTDYNPGGTFTINTNTTLYAKWKYPHTDSGSKVTWDLTKTSYDTMGANSATWNSDHITISASKETSSNAVNSWCPPEKEQTRFYKNSSLAITPASGYKINSIVFTTGSNDYAKALKNSSWTNATASYSNEVVTVIPTTKTSEVSVSLGAVSGINQIEVNYAVYHALDHISISGTYPITFTQGDSFSHEGMTVTATYDNLSTADVTSSASWSGYNLSTAGNQTVTVSYTEELVTKTVNYSITVNAAPCIAPEKESTTGQVGGEELLSFTYTNLNGNPSVISNATSIVTISNLYFDGTDGLVQLNFVGSGTTTVLFKDGDTQMASVSVTVTRTTNSASNKLLSADLTATASCTAGFTITKSDKCSLDGDHHKDGGTADSEVNYFIVKRASALFSTAPESIKFTAKLRGGTARATLNHNVEACFVDSDGAEIEATKRTVVTGVTATATNYTISLPYSASAYGVKIMHIKEASWNVFYYSFELSYDYGSSIKTITANEVKDGNGITTSVNSVVLRFGAKFSTDNWTAFNEEHTIQDYGVMFARKTTLDANSISSVKNAYETKESLLFVVRKGSSAAPSLSGENRVFTAYLNIEASDYSTVFYAAPFIVSGGQYYFLNEMRYSVKTLAAECQTTHDSPLSDEALAILNS